MARSMFAALARILRSSPQKREFSALDSGFRGNERRIVCAFIALVLIGLGTSPARAQDSVAEFYRGRNLNLIVGYSAGGGYDTYSRILARHLGKHIPGNPAIVVQNMPGAGSLKLANYLFNVAPKDGSTIGIFSRGMAMEPLIGASNTQFDSSKFAWLGSGTSEVSVFVLWHTAPVKTFQDMLTTPFTVGGEGSGSDPDIYALLLKNAFGAKLKLISGYPGTAEVAIALERGEVDSRASWSWSSIKTLKPDWIREKKVIFPVQLNLSPGKDLPDVPLIMQFARTDAQRQMLKLILSRQEMARPYAAPPGIPNDRKAALRKAFDETWADPELLAEMKARGQEVNPVSGADIDKLVAELYATPKDVVAETRKAISGQ
jgi:tripartite-type tricarboxylate transporter receptor subunit TctC